MEHLAAGGVLLPARAPGWGSAGAPGVGAAAVGLISRRAGGIDHYIDHIDQMKQKGKLVNY